MANAFLEHVNLTVKDAKATANVLESVFDWKIRWHGSARDTGISYHVGNDNSYVALYTPAEALKEPAKARYEVGGSLNHVGIVVSDLDAIEDKVKAMGFRTYSHGDYEPGRRFYFDGPDGVEYEVVSYDN